MDRKKHSALDKTILAETEPEEKSQRPKKPRKQLPPLAKAFADSDDDDESDAVGSEDDQNESSGEEDDSWMIDEHSTMIVLEWCNDNTLI